ncbi:MAG: FkbH like protein [Acidobacteriaceae bacterium]|nr:FkbH like protein [Acidobacteriaceae bacterium]
MSSDDKTLDLRKEIDAFIAAGAPEKASLRLGELWRKQSGSATAAFVVSRYEQLRGKLASVPYRLAIARSFTVEPTIPLLRAVAFVSGIDLTVHVGDFNAYPQEILDESSSLYRFSPDAVILAVRTADIAPDLWQEYSDLAPDAVRQAIHRVSNNFQQWIRAFRQRSQATLIVHLLEQPTQPNAGVLDAQLETSQSSAIRQTNAAIRQAASEHRGVYVLDYDALVARYGRLNWRDERKWLIARMPIAASQLNYLSQEWLRFLVPLTGKVAKALVVDLDNTLWGGVIGEDGMNGIKLSAEYPGAAYQSLQRVTLDLTRRGILLAICSKNNLDDAMEALNSHPGMLLRPNHFAAMRINWNDKAQNVREIAAELNIGIDSLALMDDNPVECEQIRAALPEVTVIELPEDPLQYAATLRECPVFERLTLSTEDQQRTAFYVEQRERSQAEQTFQSKEDFYRYLEQEADIAPVTPASLARISQLTQKTNQFNLTTKRYTEQQISELAARPDHEVFSIRARDRFGDHGLVGVAITRDNEEACEIDTFLLSCRVIGRSVETALLSYLGQRAAGRGKKQLAGWFVPTKKNLPAKEFYPQHGFQLESQNGDGLRWALDLKEHPIAHPEWIKLNVMNGENG